MERQPLRAARVATMLSFLIQGATFALLITRVPALQDQYGISDGLLTVLLAVVPIVAGVGSVSAEALAKRFSVGAVLRIVQPLVCLSLIPVSAFHHFAAALVALLAFGFTLGAVDAMQNMQGVALQHRYGRSIMLGFHASYSLGAIIGASLAWVGAHWHFTLLSLFTVVAVVLAPLAVIGGHWYPRRLSAAEVAERQRGTDAATGRAISLRPLLPLCLAMTLAYIGDSTASNWSAKYLQDTLHGSDQLSTVPYNAYMVTMLLTRSVGDLLVRRFGARPTVRLGSVVAALGFCVVVIAPGPWIGILGFVVVGLGLCVVVPQTFAAGGRLFPGASDAAVARLNVFNYVGVLIGSPLVGIIGDASSYRAAMVAPLLLVLAVAAVSRAFPTRAEPEPAAEPAPSAPTPAA